MNAIYEFYGYFLHGTGSAIYARDLTRALNQAGVDVVLFSQETNPEDFDFVTQAFKVKSGSLEEVFSRNSVYRGRTIHVKPDLKGLLPVYVYDSYPGYKKLSNSRTLMRKPLMLIGSGFWKLLKQQNLGLESSPLGI